MKEIVQSHPLHFLINRQVLIHQVAASFNIIKATRTLLKFIDVLMLRIEQLILLCLTGALTSMEQIILPESGKPLEYPTDPLTLLSEE